METITANAMSSSLLARQVYGTCFPQRDGLDLLCSEFAAAREKFFTGGQKRVRVGRREVVRGFDGKLRGKLSRRGLYWKKTAAGMAGGRPIDLEEVFDQRGGYVLVRRDFRNVIVSRTFFDKGLIWLKSEYYEPWDPATARVIFKPTSTDDTIERFDWDGANKRYRSTMLYPAPYLAGSPQQSIVNSRFGEAPFLVSTPEGQFCYCPKKEAEARKKTLDDIQAGTIVLMPAWEVKEGALAKDEAEEESDITFTSLEEYASIRPREDPIPEAPQAEDPRDEEPQEQEPQEPEPQEPEPQEAPEGELPAEEEPFSPEPLAHAAEEAAEPAPEDAGAEPTDREVLEAAHRQAEAEEASQTEEEILLAARKASQAEPAPAGEGPGAIRLAGNARPAAYRGEYQDGRRHGFGSAYYKDGQLSYAGFWNGGKKEGLGVSFRDGDHALHIARWENGKPGGFVSLFDSQGNLRYGGRFENGKKQGAGVSVNPQDGTIFVGKWQEGQPTGVGSAFDQEGNLLYYGQWKDGKRHGQGTEFDRNGTIVFDGEWRDGKYHNGILYQKRDGDAPGDEGADGPDWDL